LKDAENNMPLEKERFDKIEDNRVGLRCNSKKICKPLLETGSD
jgi:hypothetical protein